MAKLKPSAPLQEAVNAAAFLSTEVQMRFGELVGDSAWEVDFGGKPPTLTFTGAAQGAADGADEGAGATHGAADVVLPANLAGTLAEGANTWHWGWDNINEFPQAVVRAASRVLEYGTEHSIPELTATEVKADTEQALRLVLAAKLATDVWAHYPAEAGPQSTAWLLVQGPTLALGEPSITRVVRALAATIQQVEVTDHRAALESYARLRGFALAPLDEGGLRILAADGSADVTFDELNRLANCQVHAPLDGEAAEQFAAGGTVAPLADIGAEQGAEDELPEQAAAPQAAEEAAASAADSEDTAADDGAAAEAAAAEDAASEAEASETQTTEPEKKGFFKKLFGR